ncbi:MAG: protein kinase [Polyangiaceae bacterium]
MAPKDSKIRALDPNLRDLAKDGPLLLDEEGRSTGLRLLEWLGAGGMGAVFLAVLETREPWTNLSNRTPQHLAVKILKPSTLREAERLNIDVFQFFSRDAYALERVMMRSPPTDFVVEYYGSGRAAIEHGGATLNLPWIALEHVGGGPEGVTLTERVTVASNVGVDPLRAYRLLHGVFEGVSILHDESIVHRDLKPDNVLVAGPVDDEVPKLTDCGIAAIPALSGTTNAFTPEYAAPEQALSVTGEKNPLIGRWTDLHALSAVVWFVLGGDTWCLDVQDPSWRAGVRRGLASAPHLHKAFSLDPTMPGRIDAVLARGAAHRLPEIAYQREGAAAYRTMAQRSYPSMMKGEPRYESLAEMRAALFPLLEKCISDWQSWCSMNDQLVATAFRNTRPLHSIRPNVPLCAVDLIDREHRGVSQPPSEPARPEDIVFTPDGKLLVRFGESLSYFSSSHIDSVKLPEERRSLVTTSRWLTRGPGGGFALVGAEHVLWIRDKRFLSIPLPVRRDGSPVGRIQAILSGGPGLGVLTEETEESNGGPELWFSREGTGWEGPIVVPLSGDPVAAACGPGGYLVVGSRRGRNARALFLQSDGQAVVFTVGVNDRPPLRVAVCGVGQDRWAAGDGYILQFQRGTVVQEASDVIAAPQAMALDPVGVPWLLTANALLRRHVEHGSPRWTLYHQKEPSTPPWIGVGFTGEGVQVMDALGGATLIVPSDITFWKR